MPEKPRQPLYAFEDGSLLITGESERMAIAGWPVPRALRRTRSASTWRRFSPALRLVQPYRRIPESKKEDVPQLDLPLNDTRRRTYAQEKRRAFDRFRFSLPREVAQAVEGFPSGQWPLLVLLVKYPAARELGAHNPVLAFLLAHHFVRERFSAPEVAGFLKFRQQELLRLLDLPDQKSLINILKKVHPPALTIAGAEALRRGLQNERLRLHLGHMSEITTGVLSLIGYPEAATWCSPKLLQEVAAAKEERYRAETASLFADICRMREVMEEEGFAVVLRSRAQARRVHAEHRQRFREWTRRPRGERGKKRFPSRPPVPPALHIEPLTSARALEEEGRAQDNCVASYAKKVLQGSTYIYRVMWPERATLSLLRDETGNWVRGELEIAGNRPVSARTARFVDEWLRHYRIGL